MLDPEWVRELERAEEDALAQVWEDDDYRRANGDFPDVFFEEGSPA